MAVLNYETVFIAEPETSNDLVDQLVNKIKNTLGSHGGSLTAEDRWGRRRMAYAIQGHRDGLYSVLTFSAEPTVVTALDHLFNVSDNVIRHLTTRIIKKNKKFAPRRERPAGAPEGRPTGRPGSRPPRTESLASSASAPAAASTPLPAAAPAQPATPPSTPPASPTEGSSAS